MAFWPQTPGQGSTHLFRMHACVFGQSLFNTHCGRQPLYGSPKYSIMQVQIPPLHCVLDPQGEGVHGSGLDN